jgi:hypothetical protein
MVLKLKAGFAERIEKLRGPAPMPYLRNGRGIAMSVAGSVAKFSHEQAEAIFCFPFIQPVSKTVAQA